VNEQPIIVLSEQPKVVSGVCVANSKAERFYRSAEDARIIPLPLKLLRSFWRNRTAKAVLGKLNLLIQSGLPKT